MGENHGGFMRMWGWFWANVGLDFNNRGDVSRGGLFVYTMKNPYAKVTWLFGVYWAYC